MAGWHHWLDGSESEWTRGIGDGQGGLACYDSWCCKDSDRLSDWTELNWWRPRRLPKINTKKDILFIIGDWNVKAGIQEISGVTGKLGLGVQNEAEQSLTKFCQENALVIANTHFQLHRKQFCAQTSPNDQYWNQIDYILCSQRWRSCIQLAKTKPGADCGSDHQLLITKFRFKLRKVGKTNRQVRYKLN